jgi:UDP-N-acetylmuramate dehydrogenase
LFEPADKEDAIRIILYLQNHEYPFFILGKGTNVLISDDGIRGAVLNFEHGLNTITIEDGLVIADAGVHLTKFVDFCIGRGYNGVEMLAGIPGTVGGAIVMNAGAYGGEISTHLVEIETLRKSKIILLKKEDAGFAYRRSGLERDVILSASFKLPAGEKVELMNTRREILLKRNQSQPLNYPNAGCMFKNPESAPAAKLIEQAGLKGVRRGKAQISEKHANFMVNTGNAMARDMIELIEFTRSTVLNRFGVKLELEVKLVGFSNNTAMTVNL